VGVLSQFRSPLAAAAGAEVRRGVTVTKVSPGAPPTVDAQSADGLETFEARLVCRASPTALAPTSSASDPTALPTSARAFGSSAAKRTPAFAPAPAG